MDLDEFKKKSSKKSKIVTVRTTEKDFHWMKKHNISPTKVFDNFLEKAKKKQRR